MKKKLLLLPLLAFGLSGCGEFETQSGWIDITNAKYTHLVVIVGDFRQTYETQKYDRLQYCYTTKAQGIVEMKVDYKFKSEYQEYHQKENIETFMGHISYALV